MDFTIEELSMNAWPSLQTLVYDGWILRLSDGYGHRANSVNPIYPSKIKLEKKIAYCDELFTQHNIPTAFKLVDCEEHRKINQKLEKLSYRVINETSIQVCNLKDTFRPSGGIMISGDFCDRWIKSIIEFNKIDEKNQAVLRKILHNIRVKKIVAHKELDGKIIGCGCGIIENGYAGIFDIVVQEKERGKGYGREIVEAILAEAVKLGIKKSYLQVMLNNPVALQLYKKLGYREKYQYWYRKKITPFQKETQPV